MLKVRQLLTTIYCMCVCWMLSTLSLTTVVDWLSRSHAKRAPVQSKRQIYTDIHLHTKSQTTDKTSLGEDHAHLHIQTTHTPSMRLTATHGTSRGAMVNLFPFCLTFSQLCPCNTEAATFLFGVLFVKVQTKKIPSTNHRPSPVCTAHFFLCRQMDTQTFKSNQTPPRQHVLVFPS